MEKKESNVLIAEFMGAEKTGAATIAIDGSITDLYKVGIYRNSTWLYYDKPTRNGIYEISGLQYDTSWSWLMPVVEKIESLVINDNRLTFRISQNMAYIYQLIPLNSKLIVSSESKTKIEATYEAIIQFIQWYQSL